MSDERIRLLVAGLGNVLMSDDGVGVHAARMLAADPPHGAIVADVGTAVLDAQPLLERADILLAMDAVDTGRPPGTIVRFEGLPPAVERICSLHDFDLRAVLRLLRWDARPRVIVLGVQPARIEAGLELSPPVRAAIPRLIATARAVAAALGPEGSAASQVG